jgi:regulator of nucleoside diphosphate kinase
MESRTAASRVFTQLDYVRITRLITQDGALPAEAIETVLGDGDLVESPMVPPTVVTMYTQVILEEEGHAPRKLTLCYPSDAEPSAGFVSVFSPVGAALLGLSVGQEARWTAPGGREGRGRIAAILFQPESTGDYTT